jgi:hypothetical protein
MEDSASWMQPPTPLLLPSSALGLLLGGDRELLRELLSHLSLPEGAEQVALSLNIMKSLDVQAAKGLKSSASYLLSSREGELLGFCGDEPPEGAAVIPWAALEPLLVQTGGALSARFTERWPRVVKEGILERLAPLLEEGDRLSREGFAALLPWQPLLEQNCFAFQLELCSQLEDARAWFAAERGRLSLAYAPALRAYHKKLFAVGHLAVLASAGGHRRWMDTLTKRQSASFVLEQAFYQGITSVALRGCWSLGRAGAPFFSDYLARAPKVLRTQESNACFLGLMILGLGHPERLGQAKEMLRRLKRVPDSERGEERQLRLKLKASCAKTALSLLEQDEEILRDAHRKIARSRIPAMIPKLPASARGLPERPEEIPEDLLGALCVDESNDYMTGLEHLALMMSMPPWLYRVGWEHLYLPREIVSALRPHERPEQTLGFISTYLDNRVINDSPLPPPKAPPKPGRNEPCPCGSGKKYKSCHGAN